MTTRTARCGCGRAEITVEDEPVRVILCHCNFCQRRTGSTFAASGQWAEKSVVAVNGETKRYNGLEVDGVSSPISPGGVNYYFCPTCGSVLYWDWGVEGQAERTVSIGVGNFGDPSFPMPTVEFGTGFRHDWVPPVPDADQF